MKSQNQEIEDYLVAGNTISQRDSIVLFDCFRLSARIWDLREKGTCVHTEMVTSKNSKTYAEYSM